MMMMISKVSGQWVIKNADTLCMYIKNKFYNENTVVIIDSFLLSEFAMSRCM